MILYLVGWLFFLFAVFLDLLSLVLAMKRNKKGYGASGIPVIPWFIYLFCANWEREPVLPHKGLDFIALTVFHISCQYVIPGVHSIWRQRGSRSNPR